MAWQYSAHMSHIGEGYAQGQVGQSFQAVKAVGDGVEVSVANFHQENTQLFQELLYVAFGDVLN